jgi:hypothetical protein
MMNTNYESPHNCLFPHTGDKRNAYKVFEGPTVEGGDIETGWEGMHCIHLVQGREKWRTLANAVINLVIS